MYVYYFIPLGKIYFVNHQSRTTQWEDPRISIVQQVGLPPGWEEKFTETGIRYFVNHISRSTTLDDPRETSSVHHSSSGQVFFITMISIV